MTMTLVRQDPESVANIIRCTFWGRVKRNGQGAAHWKSRSESEVSVSMAARHREAGGMRKPSGASPWRLPACLQLRLAMAFGGPCPWQLPLR